MKRALWILWPSFIVAGVAEAMFVFVLDPVELVMLGDLVGVGRVPVYSAIFLLCWLFAAASSAFTLFLEGSR
ncbi:MAG TPA: hypothetical protein VF262_12335 [Burkholderiales bacterium]